MPDITLGLLAENELQRKHIAQLEAELKQAQEERDALVLTLEELLHECWDTPKAEQIIRDALKEIESDV